MNNKHDFVIRIVIPTLLVFCLFTVSIFVIIIPAFERNMLDRKREMIKEITNSTWSILEEHAEREQMGVWSREKAQSEAVKLIQNLRYGAEGKDYFWLTDMHPVMVMHPYRSELNGTDLSNYPDSDGKKLFVEFVKTVRADGEGYVDYMWQWKDDSTRIVPKLSFVKGFPAWDWIIGTGIYIEDVKEEIASITRNLVTVSFGILVILAVILMYLNQQSLKIEKKRLLAEDGLRESEAKYRALVEASTEGLVMMLDGEYVYANQALKDLLGYAGAEQSIEDMLCGEGLQQTKGSVFFKRLKNNEHIPAQVETQLVHKAGYAVDVILFSSEITFGMRSGHTIIVKDVSTHKKIKDELDQNKAKYETLIENISIGLFRTTMGRKAKFVEANASILSILGYPDREELLQTNLFEIVHNTADQKQLTQTLISEGFVKNSVFQIRKKDGSLSMISVSAVLVKDEHGEPLYCDGIVEDITDRIRLSEERENLIVELQTSLRFLNEPVEHFFKKPVICDMNWPISKVAKLMTQRRYSASFLAAESGAIVGMITDRDLRERAVAEYHDLNKPVYEIMSSPVISIHSYSTVFQAILYMKDKAIRHLAVKNSDGEIIGIINSEELLTVQRHSSSYLLQEIEFAESVEDIINSRNKLPILVKALVDSGAKTKSITGIITSIFNAIVDKLIGFAIEELGEPPARFVFMALGSAGREEQTLISDQDNAIIYEDVSADLTDHVTEYFGKLSNMVCNELNACGYVFCKGEAMAKNPKWCQSLSQWKTYFHKWITQSDPQDLIDLSIFFDFRCVYGDCTLSDELRETLFQTADGQAGFMQHLTKNSLFHKPPVGLMGKIVVESKGDHAETFDIKNAIMPISDFARIYAIKDKVSETNTLERLHAIVEKGIINKTTYNELVQAYNYLMQLRFKHHTSQITRQIPADNFINPNSLTHIEQNTLKNTFTQILSIQKKLNYDFSGEAI